MRRKKVTEITLGAAVLVLTLICWRQQALINQIETDSASVLQESRRENLERTRLLRHAREEVNTYRQQAAEVHALRSAVRELAKHKRALEEFQVKEADRRGRGLEHGELVETGEPLNVAIAGTGFLEIQMENGKSGYTRDGRLRLDSDGRFVANGGQVILNGLQPVPPGTTRIEIAPNGEVTMSGAAGVASSRLHLIRFSNPAGLVPLGNLIYAESSASGPPEAGNPAENDFGELAQRFLEKLE